nr:phage tail sheath subtilisin-like domain-containing protein [Dechloromonas sp.]
MPTYRTPDVYIEEISVFPPSVAEVETAIPAFIGYTAKADQITAGDLVGTPKRIKSLLEFEAHYGQGPRYAVSAVSIDDAGNFLTADIANSYLLYDSLRLFFDNGGGDCYIVSVGSYGTVAPYVDRDTLKNGVKAVAKTDEPTILLFPDAAMLSADDLAIVQQEALKQCGELKDRVAVLDTILTDPLGATFRDRIGINNLKYGAAYTPWLKLNYSKNVGYADVKGVVTRGGVAVALKDLTTEKRILDTLAALDAVIADAATLDTRIATLQDAGLSVAGTFAARIATYKAGKTAANAQALFNHVYSIARLANGLVAGTPLTSADLVGDGTPEKTGDINTLIAGNLVPVFSELIALEKELAAAAATYTVQWSLNTPPTTAVWAGIFVEASGPAASAGNIPAAGALAGKLDAALPGLQKAFSAATGALSAIVAAAGNYRTMYEQSLYDNFLPYRNIIRGISNTLTVCPPSGAIAGIYALVDGQRGVWKAPANVSLNGVVGPTTSFTSSETDALNVDATAGKSINAIRAFAGKGTLVWGARTLAGNDNEWRYVSVRRFFNMVEESIKKSTYWAVFEPNDANTWVKVRGMIENYLTQKWREGALAGATTKDAFFVRCALGVTMNAQDILEGRLNVEVGMAVVRPAEFIILKFSHKLQTS